MSTKRPRAKRARAKRNPSANAKKLVVGFNESGKILGVDDDEDMDSMDFDSIEKRIEQMCEDTNTPTPLVFLKTVMDGKDPRRNSNIFRHLLVIEEMYGIGEAPPAGSYEWAELVDMIKMDYQQAPVTLQESQQAAKQVAEYMHSKKRNVQIQAQVTQVEVTALSAQEVKVFQRKFDSKY